MISIHCTGKLLKALKQKPIKTVATPLNRLGGWYANIIPTPAGETVLFTSEAAFVSILIPAFAMDELLPMFVKRVERLLKQLDLPPAIVEQEMALYSDLVIAKTASRRVLATMNRIADDLWDTSEAKLKRTNQPLSISDAEDDINSTLRGPEPFFRPVELAREIMLAPQE